MSSVFISFCFIKTVTGNDKYVTGSALYRMKGDEDKFREIIYKGFTGTSETLIMDFEKDSIVLVIGRYVYEENVEYVTLIQTVPISYSSDDSTNTQEDLYSAPALTNSYKSNDEIGRHNNLKKTIMSVIGRFKIGSQKRSPHIMASDIEWNYAGNIGESQSQHSSNKGKTKSHEDLDNQLDIIDEKYAKMNSESLKKEN
ncbi:7021_t:CDS:2 [Diversispora eburnea]|uniref:7021_t:CDS:1 n=1 Tax=Diversispora eburnea TaxID=1213867 RepID=A0A9N9C4G0_9GLOM|nr:7021_t:CDS:2 [Diversispora eburnea]